ncbi:hypothetical protein FC756_15480 [Lysinibacillus mangiferihumi]|uniref:OB domain-containing protein n=1 Tax=Lysinibacillus mangiferihumi TaxID=1130819 RepID=A0A4U2YXE9_9BACI|nr:hypothetical protein [Lysinibacillus mangiferihumi]TKI66327.1 hypothetical protein FC756_15480 [Lysinibacillus mangiferihumi]
MLIAVYKWPLLALQDEFGTVSVTLFPQVFHLVQELLLEDELLYIERTLEKRFGRLQVKVNMHKRRKEYEIEGILEIA